MVRTVLARSVVLSVARFGTTDSRSCAAVRGRSQFRGSARLGVEQHRAPRQSSSGRPHRYGLEIPPLWTPLRPTVAAGPPARRDRRARRGSWVIRAVPKTSVRRIPPTIAISSAIANGRVPSRSTFNRLGPAPGACSRRIRRRSAVAVRTTQQAGQPLHHVPGGNPSSSARTGSCQAMLR